VSHWPRRVFHDGAGVGITLLPVQAPATTGGTAYTSLGVSGPADGPATSVALGQPVPDVDRHVLDGVEVTVVPDRRRFGAIALLPAVDAAFARRRGDLADWPDPHPGGAAPNEEEYSRCEDPGRYRLLGVRADAWVEEIVSAGLGSATPVAPDGIAWAGDQHLRPTRATVLRGRHGSVPVVVAWASMEDVDDTVVLVGVGEPTHLLDRQPDCGCDACDTGSADLLSTVDGAFVLALSGGVHVVREGDRVVTRTLDGWSASGGFERGEQQRWLDEAAAGRRTDGVVRGEPWL
jgi:hypothetical protein